MSITDEWIKYCKGQPSLLDQRYREIKDTDDTFQVRTVYWDSFPAYQDRLAILECLRIGDYVEDLPFNIPANALTWRIAVSRDTRLSAGNSLDMFYLEFIKVKCYKDSSRHIRWFVWKRVH